MIQHSAAEQPSVPRLHAAIAVVAGASGFIGRNLLDALRGWGYETRTIGRAPGDNDASWDDPTRIAGLIGGSDLLVNFAGRGVGCRSTDRNRQELWDSRIHTTRMLTDAVRAASAPPRLWRHAATATLYRHAMDRPQSESDGDL